MVATNLPLQSGFLRSRSGDSIFVLVWASLCSHPEILVESTIMIQFRNARQ
jgi:hypothetical protein